jgi:predicted nucleotidyltransferase
MAGSKKAIIQTLLYSALFEFPLTEDEIYYYLQSNKLISKKEFKESLSSLKNILVTHGGFYTLKGYEKSIELRRKRNLISVKKGREALKIARVLGYIPTILFIGISGSVAVGNATETDDIDFFVVTTNKSLYTTRLLILITLQLLGRRRKRNDVKPRDKACVNMLVDQDGMSFKNPHDLYTARELVQLFPLFERDDYYQKLLTKNNWTRSLMPHALGQQNEFLHKRKSFLQSFSFIEFICRSLEQKLIKRNQTRETITNHTIALHPFDTKNKVLAKIKEQDIHYSKYYK